MNTKTSKPRIRLLRIACKIKGGHKFTLLHGAIELEKNGEEEISVFRLLCEGCGTKKTNRVKSQSVTLKIDDEIVNIPGTCEVV